LKALIACEYSQVVTKAFRDKGVEAYSCDLLPTEGNPAWHIQDDVRNVLRSRWASLLDLMIAHPVCRYLCRHYARWESREDITEKRAADREFFLELYNADIPRKALENPVPLKISNLPPYSQIIQPWQFGHDYSKKTCLWLVNLPLLQPTKVVSISYSYTPRGRRFTKGWYMTPRNWRARSRTFTGIAEAMAEQWGNEVESDIEL